MRLILPLLIAGALAYGALSLWQSINAAVEAATAHVRVLEGSK